MIATIIVVVAVLLAGAAGWALAAHNTDDTLDAAACWCVAAAFTVLALVLLVEGGAHPLHGDQPQTTTLVTGQ